MKRSKHASSSWQSTTEKKGAKLANLEKKVKKEIKGKKGSRAHIYLPELSKKNQEKTM